MATKRIIFGLLFLLVTQQAQGIVSDCAKSAVEEYGMRGQIVPSVCENKTKVNTNCWVLCRTPRNSQMEIRCNQYGVWDDDKKCSRFLPQCEEYSNRGVTVVPGCVRDVGETCDVLCNGHGFMKIHCNGSGQWEEIQNFSCVRACPKLNVMNANDTTIQSDSEIGKTMEFQCHDRFVLQGHEKVMCQANYTWDHTDSFCESRRFAHEVVKAMKDFFLKINKNNDQGLDLIILLDVSHHKRVRITVDLVKSLILRCEENQRRKFYTLITYGKEGHVHCTVCNYETIIRMLNDVAKRQHKPAGSNLGSGLSRIFTHLLLGDHLSRHRDRILLLVTGKNPGISNNHQLWTKILREDAAFSMFVVSLDDPVSKDDRVNKEEMKRLADQPWQNHYFHLEYSEIHEAVGNLTNNGSGIVNTTGHLVQRMMESLNAGKVSRLFIYMEVPNSSEIFTLLKQVTENILDCMDESELKVALSMDNVTEFISVNDAIDKLHDLQLPTLHEVQTRQYQWIKVMKDNDNLHILFIYSSGRMFEIGDINNLKDLGYEIYAVGVGEKAKLEEMQDLVSFPWYRHLVHASEGTFACDG